jgi:hypothetical protein
MFPWTGSDEVDATNASSVYISSATAVKVGSMDDESPNLERLKHKPVFLLPYAAYDGPYAKATDCLFLSLGWAQYDPRCASLKALRHSGSKWSRQSEEIPLHRAVDLVILLAAAVRDMTADYINTIKFKPETFENQPDGLLIQAGATSVVESKAFAEEITTDSVRRQLGSLRNLLNELHHAGRL